MTAAKQPFIRDMCDRSATKLKPQTKLLFFFYVNVMYFYAFYKRLFAKKRMNHLNGKIHTA